MAWGAIGWNFKSQIIILGKSVNSETYIEDTGRTETQLVLKDQMNKIKK